MVLEAVDELKATANQLYWICRFLHLAYLVIDSHIDEKTS